MYYGRDFVWSLSPVSVHSISSLPPPPPPPSPHFLASSSSFFQPTNQYSFYVHSMCPKILLWHWHVTLSFACFAYSIPVLLFRATASIRSTHYPTIYGVLHKKGIPTPTLIMPLFLGQILIACPNTHVGTT